MKAKTIYETTTIIIALLIAIPLAWPALVLAIIAAKLDIDPFIAFMSMLLAIIAWLVALPCLLGWIGITI